MSLQNPELQDALRSIQLVSDDPKSLSHADRKLVAEQLRKIADALDVESDDSEPIQAELMHEDNVSAPGSKHESAGSDEEEKPVECVTASIESSKIVTPADGHSVDSAQITAKDACCAEDISAPIAASQMQSSAYGVALDATSKDAADAKEVEARDAAAAAEAANNASLLTEQSKQAAACVLPRASQALQFPNVTAPSDATTVPNPVAPAVISDRKSTESASTTTNEHTEGRSSPSASSSSPAQSSAEKVDEELLTELASWKVAQLKEALDDCEVPRHHLLEKKELVQALRDALHANPKLQLRIFTYCKICCRTLPTDQFWPLSCIHLPCEDCLGRHLAVEAEKMQRNAKRHDLPCLFPDCACKIPMSTATEFCKKVRTLWDNLGTRERLTKDAKYQVVECPEPGCVGIAYIEPGRSKAMCFVCEHQWTVDSGANDTSNQAEFSMGVKKCPKCQSPIEKTWGCNHMECTKCGRRFNWTDAQFANDAHQQNASTQGGPQPEANDNPFQDPAFQAAFNGPDGPFHQFANIAGQFGAAFVNAAGGQQTNTEVHVNGNFGPRNADGANAQQQAQGIHIQYAGNDADDAHSTNPQPQIPNADLPQIENGEGRTGPTPAQQPIPADIAAQMGAALGQAAAAFGQAAADGAQQTHARRPRDPGSSRGRQDRDIDIQYIGDGESDSGSSSRSSRSSDSGGDRSAPNMHFQHFGNGPANMHFQHFGNGAGPAGPANAWQQGPNIQYQQFGNAGQANGWQQGPQMNFGMEAGPANGWQQAPPNIQFQHFGRGAGPAGQPNGHHVHFQQTFVNGPGDGRGHRQQGQGDCPVS